MDNIGKQAENDERGRKRDKQWWKRYEKVRFEIKSSPEQGEKSQFAGGKLISVPGQPEREDKEENSMSHKHKIANGQSRSGHEWWKSGTSWKDKKISSVRKPSKTLSNTHTHTHTHTHTQWTTDKPAHKRLEDLKKEKNQSLWTTRGWKSQRIKTTETLGRNDCLGLKRSSDKTREWRRTDHQEQQRPRDCCLRILTTLPSVNVMNGTTAGCECYERTVHIVQSMVGLKQLMYKTRITILVMFLFVYVLSIFFHLFSFQRRRRNALGCG